MNLLDYFDPIDFNITPTKGLVSHNWTSLSTENNKKIHLYNIALFTIDCENDSIFYKEFRRLFYNLKNHFPSSFRCIDLGTLKKGSNFSDTLYATRDVTEFLLSKNIFPIIIANNHFLPYAIYLAYEATNKITSICSIDYNIKIKKDKQHYLPQILSRKNNTLFNYIHLAYQKYYTNSTEIKNLNTLHFEALRLGEIQQNIEQTEPLLRSCDSIFLHNTALQGAFLSEFENYSPNGLTNKEACIIARYAGFSEKLTSFAYLFNMHNNESPLSLSLIIWHLIEGIVSRKNDYPKSPLQRLKKFQVNISTNLFITFYKSLKTNRWWYEIPIPKSNFNQKWIVPCSEQEYIQAINGNVPDRWLYLLQKVT